MVLSPTEIEEIFSSLRNLKHRALLMTIYSGGLRIMEALELQVSDIDSHRMLIRVRQGKGKRDRYTFAVEACSDGPAGILAALSA